MLDDRDYMRQPEYDAPPWRRRFGIHWSLTVCFLIAYALVYLVESFILPAASPQAAIDFYRYFALSNAGLAHGYVWQLLTYQFMHAGFLHLFFNGWAIYVFGTAIEAELGRRRLATLMFAAGIVGGVFQALLTWISPHFFPDRPVVGASACAFGLVAAFATLYPRRELTMLVFFIIPATIQAKVLLYVSAAFAIIGTIVGMFTPVSIANAAHLGGMAMGYFFVRHNGKFFRSDYSSATHPAELEKPRRSRKAVVEDPSPQEYLSSEVDPILEKISASGINSLTRREREILEAARKKISRS